MEFVYKFLHLFIGESPSKYGIDMRTIKGVINYNIISSLVLDTSLIRVRDIGMESIGLEIDDSIHIPWLK